MSGLDQDLRDVVASELFDAQWYASRYGDVAASSVEPAEHYVRYGAALGRSPGPGFDARAYLEQHPDLRLSGGNPLLHYIRGQGVHAPAADRHASQQATRAWLATLAAARVDGEPKRMFEAFDEPTQQRFLAATAELHGADPDATDARKVSIVMPTYNRGATIGRAIASVQAQSHGNWELIIVDDGSTDDTFKVIEQFAADPRITLLRQDHKGVSAARNTGLRQASGEWVFYLDSDNRWVPEFVRTMLVYLEASGAMCGYSGIAVEDDAGRLSGFRGEPFRWDACLKGNYVDLNAFCHLRELFAIRGGFDEKLRRMVDWDLILRYTRRHGAAYAPFIGCYYLDSKTDMGRISVSQPIAYRCVVQAKHTAGDEDPRVIARAVRLRIAIKIPAPYEKRAEWGDYHYACSLQAALKAMGHTVTIDFLGTWYDRPVWHDHVVIVLRGLTAYEPRPGHINLMWNISHPDQVSYEEYEAYDRVYVASLSYPALLRTVVRKPVDTLLQCADDQRFAFQAPGQRGERLLFVGNSRNEYRSIVRWAVESGAGLDIHGTRWEKFVDPALIAGQNIDNAALAPHYAGAAAVLNDHWESMRDFGFVSNRVFDVLSCGGRLVSDAIPSIGYLFGDAVAQVSGQEELARAVARLQQVPADAQSARVVADQVARHHSFQARARALCDDVLRELGLPAVHAGDLVPRLALEGCGGPRLKVGLLMQPGRQGPTSSGFIRLLAPLTTDAASTQLEVVALAGPEDPRLADCQACIVQRTAVDRPEAALRLVAQLREQGTTLLFDTDDAFSVMDEDHPERLPYLAKDKVVRYLMSHADQVWFSTARLEALYPEAEGRSLVLRNALDPRMWRNYRKPRPPMGTTGPMRMVYMGTATHDADFALIVPALDRLAERYPGQFELSIIGAVRRPPKRDWLRQFSPPPLAGVYPRFVRWLNEQGPFDVGLAPLVDSPFNACKSDIKFLDYSALGLLSVLSDVPAYAGDAKRLGLAVHASNTEDGWFRALEGVLLDRPGHARIAQQAQRYVWAERSVDAAQASQLVALRASRGATASSNLAQGTQAPCTAISVEETGSPT